MSNRPESPSTSQAIARFFDQSDHGIPGESDDLTETTEAVPNIAPVDRPPMRRPIPPAPGPNSVIPQASQTEANSAPEPERLKPSVAAETVSPFPTDTSLTSHAPAVPKTKRMPAISDPGHGHRSARPTNSPTQSSRRTWLFGTAFTVLALLGAGLVVIAVASAVNIADKPTSDDSTIEGQPDDILPSGDLPFGEATIERNTPTTVSTSEPQRERSSPTPTEPNAATTQPSPSTVAEEPTTVPSEESDTPQPADQPDSDETATEDPTPVTEESPEPATEPPPSTASE